jgi:hypothetical protein
MSLDMKKLEKARDLANGVTQARCPACVEGGGDKKGEHLRIYPDGRYGCCVHPKDAQHRKRIFALAGERERRQFTVRVATTAKPAEPARSVRHNLAGAVRTLRTPETESVSADEGSKDHSRTLRTPISQSRAYGREESDDAYMYKDSENGVLSVLEREAPAVVPVQPQGPKLPFFDRDGTLRIPFDSAERYQWWKPPHDQRLRVKEIIAELKARQEEVDHGAAF